MCVPTCMLRMLSGGTTRDKFMFFEDLGVMDSVVSGSQPANNRNNHWCCSFF